MKKQKLTFQGILSKYGMVFVLVIMFIILCLVNQNFRTLNNFINILTQTSIFGIMALGMTLVIISKGIDLSVGSVLALAAVVAASLGQTSAATSKLFPNLPQMPLIVPLFVALLIGGLCGAIDGWLVAFTGIPAFIATLGMTNIARGAALLYTGGKPVSTLLPGFKYIGSARILGIPMPVIIFILMIILTAILLNHTRFGKYIYAIGGNMDAAVVSGVNVKKILIWVYAYCGILTGVAAIIFAGRTQSAHPGAASGYELTAIAATTIGGTSQSGGIGTVWGAVVGALILAVMRNGMTILGVQAYWQQIVEGLVIVVSVIIDMRKNARKA